MFYGKKREKCALFFGILLILLGLFLLVFWEGLHQQLVPARFKLAVDSKTYEPWIKSRVPIYVKYYFFNWTNPGDLKDPTNKPEFVEVGPYKFWEKIVKTNVTWNANGTVTYRRVRRWYFDAEGSSGMLTDKITTINTVVLMAARMSKKMPTYTRFPIHIMIASTQSIAVTRTVAEFLFEGYGDVLLTTGKNMPLTSSRVPFDKFGWFYKRNGSATFDGLYNVETGENGMDVFGSVTLWNHKNQTGFYPGKCGDVKGSGGEFFPWNRRKDKSIFLFSPDLCRYIEYEYSKEVKVSGLDGYKYVASPKLFDNGTSDPANECFCNGRCLAAGVLNISACRFDAPVFTSYPHFYLADPSYANAVAGMKPNESFHENYISLEPTYGIPMDVAARFQINVLVQPDRALALLNGVRQILFPVFWLDQRVIVPPEKLTNIKMLLSLPTANFTLAIILIVMGGLCLLSFAQCRTNSKQRLVVNATNQRKEKKSIKSRFLSKIEKPLTSRGDKKFPYPEIKSVKTLDTDL